MTTMLVAVQRHFLSFSGSTRTLSFWGKFEYNMLILEVQVILHSNQKL